MSFWEGPQVSRIKFFCSVLTLVIFLHISLCAQSSSWRPPITGIAKVAVYASNPVQSRHFYGDFLGFAEDRDDGQSATQRYRVSPQQSIEVDPLPQGAANHLEYVAFATPDVAALRRYLLGKHVAVAGNIQEQADGTQFFWVNDPEGHRIEFIQATTKARLVPIIQVQGKQVSRHILHAGFIVHDRAAENHFYRDVLGFHEAWHGGMKDGTTDWVDMQVPNGSDWIEYMLHGAAPPSSQESGVLNHFALGVASIQKTAEFLQQRGWHPSQREHAQMGRDGKWQLNLYDPDGTRVELMEFRPVQTPCCSPYTLPAPQAQP